MRVKEIITELFSHPVHWDCTIHSKEEYEATFKVGDIIYQFYAYAEGPKWWEIEFKIVGSNNPEHFIDTGDPELPRFTLNRYGVTNTGNSAIVMATVVSIMKSFLHEYKDNIDVLTFSAEERSRRDLYAAIIKRLMPQLLPNWTVTQSYGRFELSRPTQG